MFLLIGISNGEKRLDYVKTILCSKCSKLGRYEIIMTYTYLSVFFIPIFKWGRHFYVKSTCCQELYELDPFIGKKIQHGEGTDIREEHLTSVKGHYNFNKQCSSCGYTTNSEYVYCPKCGKQL